VEEVNGLAEGVGGAKVEIGSLATHLNLQGVVVGVGAVVKEEQQVELRVGTEEIGLTGDGHHVGEGVVPTRSKG
jgi:hypothetical protein